MRRAFIHIGLHKTGTTFLQKYVFRALSGIHVVQPSAGLKQIAECPRNSNLLISDESLSGMPWGESRDRAGGWRRARELSLVNLAEFFPSAGILVCFRSHGDLIESLYRQYLHEGGTARFRDFFGEGCLIQKQDLEFRPILEMLEALFPVDPFVFSMGDVWPDPTALIRRMCIFLGVDIVPSVDPGRSENRGVRGYRARVLCSMNRISRSALNPGGRLNLRNVVFRRMAIDPRAICQHLLPGDWGQDVGLDAESRQRLEDHFSDDWAAVIERVRGCRARFTERDPQSDLGSIACGARVD